MDLEVGVWLGAVEHSLRVDIGRAFSEVGGGLGRIQVGLTVLKMFDLARGVFCACEAAVQTSYLCALGEVSRCTTARRG